ncbi:hypothetical protein UlMin_019437 [Ulmus minor]
MLSVHEKPPPDPPCIPQLKDGDRDETPSPMLALPEVVDLSKPPLPVDDPPLPKFSIRDYVFTARSKDINTNWPFSPKNLQLCLKHGVKNVLPPFQPLDTVRNQSIRRCTVDSSNNISNLNNGNPSGCDDHAALDPLNNNDQLKEKLADATTSSCRSGENEFPSTTTSVCQSEIEESVPTNRSTTSPLQTDTSFEAEPPRPRVAHKATTQTTNRNSGKKCRLIVKFNSHSDRSSTEDIASNCTNVSEAMASKICPVCKTFSSSSNTTLNAHIDQCLSVESTPKWTMNSKLTRHKIKPRKSRFMVDIYTTALPCTLEDLDRRNGSNWAAVSNFAAQESEKSEMPVEDKKMPRMLPDPSDHSTSVDVGEVYIDSNGVKVRILSKTDDAPSASKLLAHLRPRKPLKAGKGSKFLPSKKKKRHVSKFNKFLKRAPQSKKLPSSKPHYSQTLGAQEKQYREEESNEEGCHMPKQVNSYSSGTLRQWVCSKRTGVAKKLNNKVSRQRFVTEDERVDNDQLCFEDSVNLNGSQNPELPQVSSNPVSSSENSDKGDQSPGRQRAGSALSEDGIKCDVGRSYPPMKRNAQRFGNDSPSVNDYHMLKPPKFSRVPAPNLSSKAVDISMPSPVDKSEPRPGLSTKTSRSSHASISKAMKISRLRKQMMPATKSKDIKKSQVRVIADIDQEVVLWDSEADQPCHFMHNFSRNQSGTEDISKERSVCKDNVVETRQNLLLPSQASQHEGAENIDAFAFLDRVDGSVPSCRNIRCSVDDNVPQLSLDTHVGETVSSLHKSVDPKVLAGPTEPSFVGGQEMFYAEQVREGMLVQNVLIEEEMDSDVGQGSSFPEVDPIPIPGPPGSFLPSPRDMSSEDFQGNSSLTTSRVQYSQDQHDVVDGDSSDSPASATSTISNSSACRNDLKFSEPIPFVRAQSVEDKIRSSLSGGSIDSSMENAAMVSQRNSAAADRIAFDKEKLNVNKIPLSFRSDDEPCCCQRKERASQSLTLNYQESQLLKRRAAFLPGMEKQIGCNNLNARSNNLETRSDMFSLSNYPTSKPEKAVPVLKSPAGLNPLRGSSDAGVRFSARSDCDTSSPSSSNSVLRLMGKNLMVVNRDQDEPVPLGQVQPQSQINHLTSQFPIFSGVSPSNTQSQFYHHSFNPNFHQGSVILGPSPHNPDGQRVDDARLSYSGRSNTQLLSSQGPASTLPNQHMEGGFMAPRLVGASARHMERVITVPDHVHKSVLSAANSIREIITIEDDVPESEAYLSSDVAKYSRGFGESHGVSSGILIPSYNSKCATPFPCYQSEDPSLHPEPQLMHKSSFHSLTSMQANASSVRWSCTSEGSGVVQQSPSVAAASSTRNVRSVLYKSQNL